jgi:DNA mismatch endonuclease, patch repair protein
MSRIRSKNTRPEIVVRSLLYQYGYRFCLHRRDLPGCPDIVSPKHRKADFVHGCFWHGHHCCIAFLPKSNIEYWTLKIEANRARDLRNVAALASLGWRVLELWECEIYSGKVAERKLQDFMGS